MGWRPRLWLTVLIFISLLPSAGTALAAQYVVDGFALGDGAGRSNPNYQSYSCRPSNGFADALRCERTQEMRGSAGRLTVFHTLIHANNGTAMYVMANASPVMLNKAIVEAEIEGLSKVIGQRPAQIKWAPADGPGRSAVIAVWGQATLEEIQGDDLDTIASGKSPHHGVLIDYFGDLQASARSGPAVFRITGGPGYLYSASFDAQGRGHRHYVAIDADSTSDRECQLSLRAAIQKDQPLASDDYRLWPEVASAVRKLTRDTSPTIANGVVDRVFAELHSTKLRSHVWSILPAGAIQRLAAGQYSRIDIYGPNTIINRSAVTSKNS